MKPELCAYSLNKLIHMLVRYTNTVFGRREKGEGKVEERDIR